MAGEVERFDPLVTSDVLDVTCRTCQTEHTRIVRQLAEWAELLHPKALVDALELAGVPAWARRRDSMAKKKPPPGRPAQCPSGRACPHCDGIVLQTPARAAAPTRPNSPFRAL